jgi:protein gp37
MSNKSAIAWTDSTWNPVTGCSKVSPGCAHCYAETLSRRFGRSFDVTLHPDRLDLPLRWRKPRRVFVNSMGDLFHERVPDEFVARTFAVMAMCDGLRSNGRSHTFQILTKRPERMRAYLTNPETPWRIGGAICKLNVGYTPLLREPDANGYRGLDTWAWGMPLPNVWLGTSIENDRFVGRADALRATPAAVRFISAEPLLGPLPSLDLTGIDWLIIGGESGPGWRWMEPEWVRGLVERADAANCAVFVKQDAGARAGKQGNLPDDLWRRKEYPR